MNKQELEHNLAELENEWMVALMRRDAGKLNQILDDDFVLAASFFTGNPLDKKRYIQFVLKAFDCKAFRFEKMEARVYDDVAIVYSLYWQRATAQGNDCSGIFVLTDIWMKHDDKWQVVSRHTSRPVEQGQFGIG